MGAPVEIVHADLVALNRALATAIAERLRSAIATRGAALLAVSGGRSPIALFEVLRGIDLPWAAVTVTLVDERWVPDTHPDSNAALVRAHLLRDQAAPATFVPLYVPLNDGTADPLRAMPACEARLRALTRPFDVVLLGMGDDGHTASWFPGAAELAAALRDDADAPLCQVVHPPRAPHARMTLTRAAVLDARLIVLQFAGAAKLAVYRRAQVAESLELPVSLVLHQQRCPVQVWIGV